MSLSFLSPAWTSALCDAVNASHAYREQAATWTHGPVLLAVDMPDGSKRFLRIDLHEGRCRSATVTNDAPPPTDFRLYGSLDAWRRLLDERLSPAAEIARRNLRFEGNWVLLAKYRDAAHTLVRIVSELDTDYSLRS